MSWIQTYTGKAFDPFDPDPMKICIEDIAHALSNICRFTGHTREFYSVAQHSVEMAKRLPASLQLAGLLHDASEAYLCDVPSPIKRRPEFQFYRDAEAILQNLIFAKFEVCGAAVRGREQLKQLDLRLLVWEARTLMEHCEKPWDDFDFLRARPVAGEMWPQPPGLAEHEFLTCFKLLTA